ncbi:MAG: hypothetical protein M3384_04265 [Acidobacteriota bacterium]|nr:hypothetical protein [Acidobacteriota bacterium]
MTFFVLVSCASRKPKHLIYGKWESTAAPKFILDFGADNLLKSELSSASGKSYEWNYRFDIDGNSARFDDDSSGDARANITARIVNENKLKISCRLGRHSDGKAMIDAPPLCGYHEFVKMKE